MHHLPVYLRVGLSFAPDFSLKHHKDSCLCFLTSFIVLLHFPLLITIFSFKLKHVPQQNIFNLGAYKFWVQFQVGSYSSPWPSASHRNHFFYIYQQLKSSSGSNQLAITVKRFLNLPKLLMLLKQRIISPPTNLGMQSAKL